MDNVYIQKAEREYRKAFAKVQALYGRGFFAKYDTRAPALKRCQIMRRVSDFKRVAIGSGPTWDQAFAAAARTMLAEREKAK